MKTSGRGIKQLADKELRSLDGEGGTLAAGKDKTKEGGAKFEWETLGTD